MRFWSNMIGWVQHIPIFKICIFSSSFCSAFIVYKLNLLLCAFKTCVLHVDKHRQIRLWGAVSVSSSQYVEHSRETACETYEGKIDLRNMYDGKPSNKTILSVSRATHNWWDWGSDPIDDPGWGIESSWSESGVRCEDRFKERFQFCETLQHARGEYWGII